MPPKAKHTGKPAPGGKSNKPGTTAPDKHGDKKSAFEKDAHDDAAHRSAPPPTNRQLLEESRKRFQAEMDDYFSSLQESGGTELISKIIESIWLHKDRNETLTQTIRELVFGKEYLANLKDKPLLEQEIVRQKNKNTELFRQYSELVTMVDDQGVAPHKIFPDPEVQWLSNPDLYPPSEYPKLPFYVYDDDDETFSDEKSDKPKPKRVERLSKELDSPVQLDQTPEQIADEEWDWSDWEENRNFDFFECLWESEKIAGRLPADKAQPMDAKEIN